MQAEVQICLSEGECWEVSVRMEGQELDSRKCCYKLGQFQECKARRYSCSREESVFDFKDMLDKQIIILIQGE